MSKENDRQLQLILDSAENLLKNDKNELKHLGNAMLGAYFGLVHQDNRLNELSEMLKKIEMQVADMKEVMASAVDYMTKKDEK